MFLRYEDFATQPRAALTRILAFIDEDGALPFVEDDTVVLGVNHTVAGNPNRFLRPGQGLAGQRVEASNAASPAVAGAGADVAAAPPLRLSPGPASV